MSSTSRRITVTAVVAAALAGATALAVPASAAPAAKSTANVTAGTTAPAAAKAATPADAQATYNGVCGAGYTVIDSMPISHVGTVFLTWNGATGKNCAVTIRNTPGTPVEMDVQLAPSPDNGVPPAYDWGRYTTYAGPVYLKARHQCIYWEGTISGVSAEATGHCG